MIEKLQFYPGSGGKDGSGREYERLSVEAIRKLAQFREEEAIDIEDEIFLELYQEAEILRDRNEVENMKARWASDDEKKVNSVPPVARPRERELLTLQKDLSSAVEYAVSKACGSYDWFGGFVDLILTSEYDDLKGIDVVAEARSSDEDSEVRRQPLTIDVTRAYPRHTDYTKEDIDERNNEIENKLEKALAAVLGERREVKYFKSEQSEKPERLERVIPIVLAIEPQHAMDLVRRLALIMDQQGKEKSPEESKKFRLEQTRMAEDPMQVILLKEIRSQLIFFKEILETRDDPHSKALLRSVTGVLEFVEPTLSEKREFLSSKKVESLVDQSAQEVENWIKKRRQDLLKRI